LVAGEEAGPAIVIDSVDRAMSATATPGAPPVAVVRFSVDPADPITMLFIDATIEVMLASKDSVPRGAARIAPEILGVAGVYVLLGPPEGEALIRARPGSGHDVLARLRRHPRESPWFTRAVVARDTRQGWNSAQAGYIEGRLHNLCRDSPGVEHDFRRDQDQTLQAHEEELLDRRDVPAIIAALQLSGAPIQPRRFT
jgi:hypothetical protein